MSSSVGWRELRDLKERGWLQGFGAINQVWMVFPQGGGPRGSYSTITEFRGNLRHRDVIILGGVLREQVLLPPQYNCAIVGVGGRPRQATDAGVPTGGGASWLAPTVVTAGLALCEVTAQAWVIENVQFAPPAALDSIRLRCMETPAIPSAGHAIIRDCYFLGGGAGGHGINLGETSRGVVEDCRFELLPGTAIRRTADGGIANTQHWDIRRNQFKACGNDILCFSQNMLIKENEFFSAVDGARKFIQITGLGVGGGSVVWDNKFYGVATAGYTIANGFEGAASDIWRNYVNDAVDPIILDPA